MTTTDDTTGDTTAAPPPDGPDAPADEGGEQPALDAPEAAPVDFWHRPYVERYLSPFVLPLLVVTGVVVFILNLSRIFLASHGNADVVVGTAITLIILIGATVLAAAPGMRTASVVLFTAGSIMALLIAGMTTLGHSEVDEGEAGGALPPEGPALAEFSTNAGPNNSLRFEPADGTVPTGIVRISLVGVTGEHTLVFQSPATSFAGLHVTGPGVTDSARALFSEAGDYDFYCTIPGHKEAGMVGVLHASGDPKPLEVALAEAEGAGVGEGAGDQTPTSAGDAGATPTTAAEGGG